MSGQNEKPYIPVVLSREEINAILQHLAPPYALRHHFMVAKEYRRGMPLVPSLREGKGAG